MVDGVAEVTSSIVRSVTPDTHLREIAQIMRDENVGDVVGTMGDLARTVDSDSALADVSAAEPDT
ncbi:hypothetical protein ACWFMI_13650 [Nocardiopsis terrae]